MPSYPSDDWDDDWAAWKHLEAQGFTSHQFVIRPPSADFVFDRLTSEAVNYLVGEWDWGYDERPAHD